MRAVTCGVLLRCIYLTDITVTGNLRAVTCGVLLRLLHLSDCHVSLFVA